MARYALTLQTLLQAPSNLAAIANQVRRSFSNINVNVGVNANTASLANVNAQIQGITTNSRAARREYSALADVIGTGARRFAAISFATGTFVGLARSIKGSLKEAMAFEREMLVLSQVTGKTVAQLSDVNDEIVRLSKSLGLSSDGLLDTAITLSQAGFSANKTKDSLEVLAKTQLAASFRNIEETTEGAIAILSQFRKDAIKAGGDIKFLEQSLGAINEVSKAFAVESSDLISTVRKAGGAFEAAGGSLNELLALFTSVRATTRESAETIATGLRTIFTRLQRVDTINALQKLGIEVQDLEGKFVGPYEAIRRISEGLASIDPRDIRFAAITEELGGFRQIGKVIPLIKQFAMSEKALAVAQSATNSLTKDQEIAQKSLENQIKRVKEEFQDLIRTFQKSDTFKGLVEGSLSIASAMIKVADAMEPILPLIASFAAVQFGKGLFGILGSASRSGIRGFNSGGIIPGSGNSDTVPAMLTPGEFVMKKSAVQKIGVGRLRQMNNGVQYFNDGGLVRKVGYIDSDVIGDPANFEKVSAAMQQLGITSISEYKATLSRMAAAFRKSGDIKKLSAIAALPGAGKSQLMMGGQMASVADAAKLRKTERIPILTPDDIKRVNEVFDVTATVTREKLDDFLKAADRVYALSTSTKEEQNEIRRRRGIRDTTGVNLFGRSPGTTTGAPVDSGPMEAMLESEIDRNKLRILGIRKDKPLKIKADQERVEAIKKKIALMYGSFSPTTKGHQSLVEAASSMGMKPEDFIVLVGSNEGITKDPSSYRTAIFDQDFRTILAKAGFGAMGAKVSKKSARDFSIPDSMEIDPSMSGRRKFVVPEAGSYAMVGAENKDISKYIQKQYKIVETPRDEKAVSGTIAREAILSGDMATMQRVLSPEVLSVVLKNMQQLQNRANLLPRIIDKVNKREFFSLSQISDELAQLPQKIDKKKVASDPEYAKLADQVAELRKVRDKIKSKSAMRPFDIISALANRYPDKYGLQYFATGGTVPGSGNSDTVPAMLTPGEFVMKKSAVQKIGVSNLKSMNEGGKVPVQHFADGGLVLNLKKNKFGAFSLNPQDINPGYINTSFSGLSIGTSDSQMLINKLSSKFSDFENIDAIMPKVLSTASVLGIQPKKEKKLYTKRINPDGSEKILTIDTVPIMNKAIEELYIKENRDRFDNSQDKIAFTKRAYARAGEILDARGYKVSEMFKDEAGKEKMSASQTWPGWLTSNYQSEYGVGGGNRNDGLNFAKAAIDPKKIKSVSIAAIGDVPTMYPSGDIISKSYYKSINESIDKELPLAIANIGRSILSEGNNIDQDNFNRSSKDLLKDRVARASISGYLLEAIISGLTGIASGGQTATFDYQNVSSAAENFAKVFGNKGPLSEMDYADAKVNINAGAKNSILVKKIPKVLSTLADPSKYLDDIKYLATGGLAKGTDTVPAMLTPGEFVIKKSSAQRIGYDNLKKMNNGELPGYNTGGKVQYFSNGSNGGVQPSVGSKEWEDELLTSIENRQRESSAKSALDDFLKGGEQFIRVAEKLGTVLSPEEVQVALDKMTASIKNNIAQQSNQVKSSSQMIGQLKNIANSAVAASKAAKASTASSNISPSLQASMQRASSYAASKQATATQPSSPRTLGPSLPVIQPNGAGGQATQNQANEAIRNFTSRVSSAALTFTFVSSSVAQVAAQMGALDEATADVVAQTTMTFSTIFGIGTAIADALPIDRLKGPLVGLSTALAVALASVELFTSGMKASAIEAYESGQKMSKELSEGKDIIQEDFINNRLDALNKSLEADAGKKMSTAIGIIGTALGAAAGGFLGSAGTPFGTVAGVAAGGSVGGIAGAAIGSYLGLEPMKEAGIAAEQSAKAQYNSIKSIYDFTNAMDMAKFRNLDNAKTTELLIEQNKKYIARQSDAAKQLEQAEANYKKVEEGQNKFVKFISLGLVGGGLSDEQNKERENLSSLDSENRAQSARNAADLAARIQETVDKLSKSGEDRNAIDLEVSPMLKQYTQLMKLGSADQKIANESTKALEDGISRTITANEKLLENSRALTKSLEDQREAMILATTTLREFSSIELEDSNFSNYLDNITAFINRGQAKIRSAKPIQSVKSAGDIAGFANNISSLVTPLGKAGEEAQRTAVNAANTYQTAQNVLLNRSVLSSDKGSFNTARALIEELRSYGANIRSQDEAPIIDAFSKLLKDERGNINLTQSNLDQLFSSIVANGEDAIALLNKGLSLTTEKLQKFSDNVDQVNQAFSRATAIQQQSIDIQSRLNENIDKIRGVDPVRSIGRRQAERDARAQVPLTRFGLNANDIGGLGESIIRAARVEIEQISRGGLTNTEDIQKFSMLSEKAKVATERLQQLSNQSDRTSDVMSKFEKIQNGINQRNTKIEEFVLGTTESRSNMVASFQGLQRAMMTGSFQTLSDDMRGQVGSLLDSLSDVEIMPGATGGDIKRSLIAQDLMGFGFTQQQAAQAAWNQTTTEQEKLVNELLAISSQEQAANSQLLSVERQSINIFAQAANKIKLASDNFADRMPGGPLQRNSGGGIPGYGNKDTIPAMLTPGEYVVKASAVRKYGTQFMDSVNNGTVEMRSGGGMAEATLSMIIGKEEERAELLESKRKEMMAKLAKKQDPKEQSARDANKIYVEMYDQVAAMRKKEAEEKAAAEAAAKAAEEAKQNAINMSTNPLGPMEGFADEVDPVEIYASPIQNERIPKNQNIKKSDGLTQRQIEERQKKAAAAEKARVARESDPKYQEYLRRSEERKRMESERAARNMYYGEKSSYSAVRRENIKERKNEIRTRTQQFGRIAQGMALKPGGPAPMVQQPQMPQRGPVQQPQAPQFGPVQQPQGAPVDVAGLSRVSENINTMAGRIEKVVNTLNGMKMEHTVKLDGIIKIGGLDMEEMSKQFSDAIGKVVKAKVEEKFTEYERRAPAK